MEAQFHSWSHFGRARCEAGALPRHRHDFGYVCVVLKGGFMEAGDLGRFRVSPGSAIVHRPFEAHRDLFPNGAVELLNLPPAARLPEEGLCRLSDVDSVARAAERSLAAASDLVAEQATPVPSGEQDWPDLLAAALREDQALSIEAWASANRLFPASVSRGFRQVYGTSPSRYRGEARARVALRRLCSGSERLAELAAEVGFADQAHMTRAIRKITGLTPARLRFAG